MTFSFFVAIKFSSAFFTSSISVNWINFCVTVKKLCLLQILKYFGYNIVKILTMKWMIYFIFGLLGKMALFSTCRNKYRSDLFTKVWISYTDHKNKFTNPIQWHFCTNVILWCVINCRGAGIKRPSCHHIQRCVITNSMRLFHVNLCNDGDGGGGGDLFSIFVWLLLPKTKIETKKTQFGKMPTM